MRALALSAIALVVASPASADSLSGTKAPEMFDRGHTIEVRIEPGRATLVITRVFENRSAKYDQAMLHMTDIPAGAVATGMRTLGDQGAPSASPSEVWFVAELLDAEVAAKKYRELTGIGGYYPKDPALLSWRSQGHLALQVFPVAPKSQKTVEITLEMPARYMAGQYVIELPRMGTESLAPNLVLKGDHLSIAGTAIKSGEVRRLFGSTTITMIPLDAPKLGGRFASVSFAKDKAVVHAAIEVAPRVSQIPKGAYVVLVLDGSRSLADADRQAELSAAKAYLAHLPDAKVQVLTFDRTPRALQDDFVTSKQAGDVLKAITPRNGSNLELALAEAGKRVATAPKGAPRRIVAFTDLATRSTLLPSQVKGLDGTKAIVHLVTIGEGAPSLARDDYDPWSAVARSTGGLLWRGHAGADAVKNQKVFEELARPLRIDRISIAGVGLKPSALDVPDTLAEGDGFDDLVLNSFPTPSIEVKGELWSTPISTVLATSPSEEKLWAGLTIGSDLLGQLRDPEIAALAFKGGAVSPMTSYLAIEPGVRPSTEGLEGGTGSMGMLGAGSGVGGFGCGLGVGSASIDKGKILREKLAAIAKKCAVKEARVHLETTWSEIVDVRTNNACVLDGVYDLELPAAFANAWEAFDVSTET